MTNRGLPRWYYAVALVAVLIVAFVVTRGEV